MTHDAAEDEKPANHASLKVLEILSQTGIGLLTTVSGIDCPRVTLRFSVDGEEDGALRNILLGALAAHGIVLKPTETATDESMNIAVADSSKAVADFWNAAVACGGPGVLDHVCMYAGQ